MTSFNSITAHWLTTLNLHCATARVKRLMQSWGCREEFQLLFSYCLTEWTELTMPHTEKDHRVNLLQDSVLEWKRKPGESQRIECREKRGLSLILTLCNRPFMTELSVLGGPAMSPFPSGRVACSTFNTSALCVHSWNGSLGKGASFRHGETM